MVTGNDKIIALSVSTGVFTLCSSGLTLSFIGLQVKNNRFEIKTKSAES